MRKDTRNKTKKILIVANSTWNIYNFRMNVLQLLLERNFKIYVAASGDKYLSYKDSFPDIQHFELKNLNRKSINPVNDVLLTLELYRIYNKIKPDLILHYTVKPNIFGGIAAWLNKIPSMAVVTGLGYAFIHGGYIRFITKNLYRIVSGFHKKFIFENTDDLLLFENEKLIKRGKGISIKGCGVNIDTFKPLTNPRKDENFVFTFIGRILYDKGVKEFVAAAKRILAEYDQVKFWILGGFDTQNPSSVPEDKFYKWLDNDGIVHLGFKDDVRKYIAQSDCIVLPSYREAIARALTEAMSMEKPVIASEIPGCNEAVDQGINGFLSPVGNVDGLVNSFKKMLSLSPEERAELGKNGRKKVLKEFDDRIIARKIVDIAEQVIN